MRDLLAWILLLTVLAMWIVTPWRQRDVLRLFNAADDDELFRRVAENRRFMASIGLVFLLDFAAIALALIILI